MNTRFAKGFLRLQRAGFALGLGVGKEAHAERAVGDAGTFRALGWCSREMCPCPRPGGVSTVGFAPWLWPGEFLHASVSPSVNGTEQLQEMFAMKLLGKEEAVLKHRARNEDSSKAFMRFSFPEAGKACSPALGTPGIQFFPLAGGKPEVSPSFPKLESSAFSSPSRSSSSVISSPCIFPFPPFWPISPEISVNLGLRTLFSLLDGLCLELPLCLCDNLTSHCCSRSETRHKKFGLKNGLGCWELEFAGGTRKGFLGTGCSTEGLRASLPVPAPRWVQMPG